MEPRHFPVEKHSDRRQLVAAVTLIVLTFLAFRPILDNGFVGFDDEAYITRNAVVQRGFTRDGLRLALTSAYTANWHPLTWISHMLDVELFGLDPRGHHAVSLALHLAGAVLLLVLLRRLTGRLGPSSVAAALFALHPLHVESVAWAAERKDVLSGLLWMAALLAWHRYLQRPGTGRYCQAAAVFALGLTAKSMVLTLPLVLLILDWWPLGRLRGGGPGGRPFAALLLEKAPLLALSSLSGLITLQAQAGAGAVSTLEGMGATARIANALLSYVRYLGKGAWPSGLSAFYPMRTTGLPDPSVIAALLLLAGLSAAAVLLRQRSPFLLAGWLWYLITLLPVIGLVQVGAQSMADRYTYLPLTGVFLAAAWWCATAAPKGTLHRGALAFAAALAIAAGALLTHRQAGLWRDRATLFRHAMTVGGDNWMAAFNLAAALDEAGDPESAVPYYRETIRLRPGLVRPRYNLALILDGRGETAEALEQLRAALKILPSDPLLRMTIALVLAREGAEGEAIEHLRQLLRIQPDNAEACNNLAALLVRRGMIDEAAALLRKAVEIDPAYGDARRNLEALTGGRGPVPDR